jgi:TM2 domain-containing membrane protein YozV
VDVSPTELAQLQMGLSDSQKMQFVTQYSGVKKDRTTSLILSVLLGGLGIDRFYIGDTGMGLLKLFTLGGCGFLAIADWFMISGKTDDFNRKKAHEIAAAVRLSG